MEGPCTSIRKNMSILFLKELVHTHKRLACEVLGTSLTLFFRGHSHWGYRVVWHFLSFSAKRTLWIPLHARRLSLTVLNGLRCGFTQFNLCAHFLEARRKGFNLLLLLRRIRFQFLYFAVLFEELVEQHRIHRFVANRIGLAVFVASYQVCIYFFHVLGYEAELRDGIGVKLRLIAKRHRFQRENRFAGFVH